MTIVTTTAARGEDHWAAIAAGRHDEAYRLVKARLAADPDDADALRGLAALAVAGGQPERAEPMLRHALRVAPGSLPARLDLIDAMAATGRAAQALAEADALLVERPDEAGALERKARILGGLGRTEEALAIRERLLAGAPDAPWPLILYGHDLRALGREEEAAAAYRRAARAAPDAGAAWWSLANLKTVRFAPDEMATMAERLAVGTLDREDETFIRFALGKAHEDEGEAEASFGHYAAGNALRRAAIRYDADETSALVRRSVALYTRAFFADRAGWGAADPGARPIFVLGMPRSGSTLVEQILASHSTVEGCGELPVLPGIAALLGAAPAGLPQPGYPEEVGRIGAEVARALGEAYLERAAAFRQGRQPRFVDKLPANWLHAGLIRLILPDAHIVEVRRDGVECGFSNFKQHFAHGEHFAYDLADIGRYQRDVRRMLDHLAALAPERVHIVDYEALVADSAGETRRLLDALGLEAEPACLAAHETERAVRTPSALQVRRPINAEGLDRARPYETFLEPLRRALAG